MRTWPEKIDDLVAEKVMGWHEDEIRGVGWWDYTEDGRKKSISTSFLPSLKIRDAKVVWDKMRLVGFTMAIVSTEESIKVSFTPWDKRATYSNEQPTSKGNALELATCYAALAAVGVDDVPEPEEE